MKKTKNVKIQFWGVGRRKKAIARVRISSGGENGIIINKKPMDEYFKTDAQKFIVKQPLELTGTADKYDVNVNIHVKRTLSIVEAHEISEKIEHKIREKLGKGTISVHIEPDE